MHKKKEHKYSFWCVIYAPQWKRFDSFNSISSDEMLSLEKSECDLSLFEVCSKHNCCIYLAVVLEIYSVHRIWTCEWKSHMKVKVGTVYKCYHLYLGSNNWSGLDYLSKWVFRAIAFTNRLYAFRHEHYFGKYLPMKHTFVFSTTIQIHFDIQMQVCIQNNDIFTFPLFTDSFRLGHLTQLLIHLNEKSNRVGYTYQLDENIDGMKLRWWLKCEVLFVLDYDDD